MRLSTACIPYVVVLCGIAVFTSVRDDPGGSGASESMAVEDQVAPELGPPAIEFKDIEWQEPAAAADAPTPACIDGQDTESPGLCSEPEDKNPVPHQL